MGSANMEEKSSQAKRKQLVKSRYAFFIKGNNDTYLVYSSYSGVVISFFEEECLKKLHTIIEADTIDFDETNAVIVQLYNKRILVEEDCDELLMVRHLYNRAFIDSKVLELMIIVTRQCNFRCTYCGQPHENTRMSNESYSKLVDAIVKLVKKRDYHKIAITFFGGEPMLEYNNIVTFLSALINRMPNIHIFSGMSTNGYLLTPERFERLAALNCLFYQISVDGMSYTHDKTRPLVNGKATWKTIINNLIYIKSTKYNFYVNLRTNYNYEVADSLTEFYKYCHDNLLDTRIKIYYETIKDQGNIKTPSVLTEAESLVLNSEIAKIINEYDLPSANYSDRISPCGMVCYASRPHFFTIDYDLTIKKCTYFTDFSNNNLGYINQENEFVIDVIKETKWNYSDYLMYSKCNECKLLPLCFGKKCPSKILHDGKLDCNSSLLEMGLKKSIIAYYLND